MAVRTTADDVKNILLEDYDIDSLPSLVPFIATAANIVDQVATAATNRGRTLTAATLELIERWLACHCYCMTDQPYASRSTLGASGSFQGQTGMYLEGTKYGQMAILLDTSGSLVALSKQQRTSAAWLGKPVSEQIPYSQRD